jgi:hypothetical protein
MDHLEQITDVFFNWQVLLLSFAAFVIVSIIRTIGTRKDKDGQVIGGWAENRYFNISLLLMPYAITIGLVFVPCMPLPEVVVKAAPKLLVVKFLYGVYAGWLSDKSYQVVKKVLEKFGVFTEK